MKWNKVKYSIIILDLRINIFWLIFEIYKRNYILIFLRSEMDLDKTIIMMVASSCSSESNVGVGKKSYELTKE